MSESKVNILLVEDDPTLGFVVKDNLEANGYTVHHAPDGETGWQLYMKHNFDICVLDVMLPKRDGIWLAGQIRKKNESVPIILLTAKNTIQSKVQGLELGADAYIEKPFSKEHLQAQIASLLANRNALREYFASSPLVHLNSMAHTRADEQFLATLHETIINHIEEVELDVEQLARYMNMSRVTLYRKIKAISDLTPIELINVTRLKKAAELLSAGDYKMYEIAALTGFSSQSNFARNFHKQFGVTPSDYALQKR